MELLDFSEERLRPSRRRYPVYRGEECASDYLPVRERERRGGYSAHMGVCDWFLVPTSDWLLCWVPLPALLLSQKLSGCSLWSLHTTPKLFPSHLGKWKGGSGFCNHGGYDPVRSVPTALISLSVSQELGWSFPALAWWWSEERKSGFHFWAQEREAWFPGEQPTTYIWPWDWGYLDYSSGTPAHFLPLHTTRLLPWPPLHTCLLLLALPNPNPLPHTVCHITQWITLSHKIDQFRPPWGMAGFKSWGRLLPW